MKWPCDLYWKTFPLNRRWITAWQPTVFQKYKLCSSINFTVGRNKGWPRKNGTANFPKYVDAITGIIVWGNLSWNNDTKICNFGSVVCFLGHIFVRQCRDQKFAYSVQPKLGVNKCHFGLSQLWAVIHLTLSMRIVTSKFLVWGMRIDKVNWITAHNNGNPKLHSISTTLSWKGNIWASTLSHQMCSIEIKLLNQNFWSWYHFSQEKLPHTLIPVIASTYCERYAVPGFFFSGPPCINCVLALILRWTTGTMCCQWYTLQKGRRSVCTSRAKHINVG